MVAVITAVAITAEVTTAAVIMAEATTAADTTAVDTTAEAIMVVITAEVITTVEVATITDTAITILTHADSGMVAGMRTASVHAGVGRHTMASSPGSATEPIPQDAETETTFKTAAASPRSFYCQPCPISAVYGPAILRYPIPSETITCFPMTFSESGLNRR
jgi:hypothetical protein